MNSTEVDALFDRLRKAGHGAVINFDAAGSGESMEGIIFDPGPQRPSGFEEGIFVAVPSQPDNIYYLDPETSRKEGRLIIQVLPGTVEKPPEPPPEDLLKEFEYLGREPDVKRGGGAAGEECSKHKGIIELN